MPSLSSRNPKCDKYDNIWAKKGFLFFLFYILTPRAPLLPSLPLHLGPHSSTFWNSGVGNGFYFFFGIWVIGSLTTDGIHRLFFMPDRWILNAVGGKRNKKLIFKKKKNGSEDLISFSCICFKLWRGGELAENNVRYRQRRDGGRNI